MSMSGLQVCFAYDDADALLLLNCVHEDSMAAEQSCGRHFIFKLSLLSLTVAPSSILFFLLHNSWIMHRNCGWTEGFKLQVTGFFFVFHLSQGRINTS